MIEEEKLEQRSITINILVKELQLKQRRLDKYRDKIYEQQDVLKDKIRRINELKEEVESWKRQADEQQNFRLAGERQHSNQTSTITRLRNQIHALYEQDIAGEKPVQKATNRKKTNGKFRKTIIN